MLEKIYLLLLILCGIWSQGIIGTRTDEEIKESSDILVREKRVINQIPGEDIPVEIRDRPYIVHIKLGTRIHCVGSILSHEVVITLASCIGDVPRELFIVVSASPRSNRGTHHNITDVKMRVSNLNRPLDGIALLTINPFFRFGVYTNKIELHSGPLLPGMVGTVSGWGFKCRDENRGTNYPLRLRTINVPILAHRDCVNRYLGQFAISDVDICTYHPQKHCGHNDGGAPLVVDGYLAGVHLRIGMSAHVDENLPDVFIMLQHSTYNQWISTSIRNTHIQFQHLHH